MGLADRLPCCGRLTAAPASSTSTRSSRSATCATSAIPRLATAIRALPPRRRLIVFLHYFADLPYRDIAEVLAISEGTVAASLAQARAALLESLVEEEVQ